MNDNQEESLKKYSEEFQKRMEEARIKSEKSKKRRDFEEPFRRLLDYTIHPAMMNLHRELRNKKMHGKWLRTGARINHYPQEHFEIHPCEQHAVYFRLSVVGNYDVQKIFIYMQYYKVFYDQTRFQRIAKLLLKTEEEFLNEDMNAEFFTKQVNKGIWQARKCGLDYKS